MLNVPASNVTCCSGLKLIQAEEARPLKRARIESYDTRRTDDPIVLHDVAIEFNLPASFGLQTFEHVTLQSMDPPKSASKECHTSIHLFHSKDDAQLLSVSLEGQGVLAEPQAALRKATKLMTLCADRGLLRKLSRVWHPFDVSSTFAVEHDVAVFRFTIRCKSCVVWSTESLEMARNAKFLLFVREVVSFLDAAPCSVATFYSSLRPLPPAIPEFVASPACNFNLLAYQKKAVNWMSNRENGYGEPPALWTSASGHNGEVLMLQEELGLIGRVEDDLTLSIDNITGGLLADEMGLGKTVELLALILLRKRVVDGKNTCVDPRTQLHVLPTKATLVVTPPSILQQWLDEIEKHAPSLSYYHYRGIRLEQAESEGLMSAEELGSFDIVLTSYADIQQEVHYTRSSPNRNLRFEKKYLPNRSPLIQLQWWRVIMDEAQMIDTVKTGAAEVACKIPRIHAWAVTGTPISRSVDDLFGLVHFLQVEPICRDRNIWTRLMKHPASAELMASLFGPITCRNTKAAVSQEIHLPVQTRYLVQVELTPVEENNFSHILSDALSALNLNDDGTQKLVDWQIGHHISSMRKWLLRLRQICTHPQIGLHNQGLKKGNMPLQTLDDVLADMYSTCSETLLAEEKAYFNTRFRRAQIYELLSKKREALDLLMDLLREVQTRLEERRKERARLLSAPQTHTSAGHVRDWIEIEHKILFLVATLHFQLGQEVEETKYYALAKIAREELLSDVQKRAYHRMKQLKDLIARQGFREIPELRFPELSGGVLTRPILEKFQSLVEALNAQANQLDEWRENAIQKLVSPLADQSDDPSGEEYQLSLDEQEDAFTFQELVRQVVSDRAFAITGVVNALIEGDLQRRKDVNLNDALRQGMVKCIEIRPSLKLGTIKSIHSELRAKLRQVQYNSENTVLDNVTRKTWSIEYEIAQQAAQAVGTALKEQKTACDDLEKEVDLFRHVFNSRLEYYRQLQTISDSVVAFTVSGDGEEEDESMIVTRAEQELSRVAIEESHLTSHIGQIQARKRYLEHLRRRETDQKDTCVICQTEFELGALTQCGHLFCKECFSHWFISHKSCPICKTILGSKSWHKITLGKSKPSQSALQLELAKEERKFSTGTFNLPPPELQHRTDLIKLNKSYSSKVDAIIKHILSLTEGTKSILYSQWKDVLTIFESAFADHDLRAVRLDTNEDAVTKFRTDPAITVIMLHGKSQAAGLNLMDATHLFLCEPLVHPAVEAQAVSRIHRIGQSRETFVWQYFVAGTVEEKILELAFDKKTELANAVLEPSLTQQAVANGISNKAEEVDDSDVVYLFQSNLGVVRQREEMFGFV